MHVPEFPMPWSRNKTSAWLPVVPRSMAVLLGGRTQRGWTRCVMVASSPWKGASPFGVAPSRLPSTWWNSEIQVQLPYTGETPSTRLTNPRQAVLGIRQPPIIGTATQARRRRVPRMTPSLLVQCFYSSLRYVRYLPSNATTNSQPRYFYSAPNPYPRSSPSHPSGSIDRTETKET
jgi:hypothetical protein